MNGVNHWTVTDSLISTRRKKKTQQVTTNKAVNMELCLLHIWEHKHDMTPIQHYDPKKDFCINTTWKHIVLLLILDESGLC